MSVPKKSKKREPITACEWINKAIEETGETARSYRKIIEAIDQRKIKEAEVPEAAFLFVPIQEVESATRIIQKIEAQERGHLDMLGMVKKDLKCE